MSLDFSKSFLFSILAHLGLIFLLTVRAVVWPEKIDPYQSAIRVDMVALPDKLSNLPPPPPPSKDNTEKSKELPKIENKQILTKEDKSVKQPEVVLKPKKESSDKKRDALNNKTSDAIEKLKKKMAIEKIKEEMMDQERQKITNRITQYKGNAISPGTDLKGVEKLQHENYLSQLDQHVKNFWILPEWLAKGNYKAQVKIYLDEKGLLINVELIKSSGNPNYDDIVVETVKKAVPYPVPPEKFKQIVEISGMVLGFPE